MARVCIRDAPCDDSSKMAQHFHTTWRVSTCLFFSPGTRARSKHRQVGDLNSFKKRQLCLIVRDPPFPQMTVEVAAGVEDCFFLPEVKSGQTIEMEFQVFFSL